MSGALTLFLVFDVVIASAIAVGMNNKGYDPGVWFFYAMLIWPVALIHGSMKPRNTAASSSDEMRKCPECAEMIRVQAKKCRYCQSAVTPFPED